MCILIASVGSAIFKAYLFMNKFIHFIKLPFTNTEHLLSVMDRSRPYTYERKPYKQYSCPH